MNQTELHYVAVHFIRCPEVVSHLLRSGLAEEDFSLSGTGALYPYAVLWGSVREFYAEFHRPPVKLELSHLVERRLARQHYADLKACELARGIINAAYETPDKELAPEYVISSLLKRFLTLVLVDPRLAIAQFVGEDDKHAVLQDIEETRQRTIITPIQSAQIMTEFENYGHQDPPVPTGVAWLDVMLTGLHPASKVGLLAWPGGGKTLAGVQIVAEAAMQGHHAAYFCYEQGVVGDISSRFYSYTTETPRTRTDVPVREYDPELLELLKRKAPIVQPYLHVYDMSGAVRGAGTGGALEAQMLLQELAAAGKLPKFAVFDWVGVMAERDMSLPSNITKTDRISRTQAGIASIADKLGVTVFCLHQLTPAVMTGKTPWFLPSQEMAHECRSFSQLMSHMLLFGLRDKETDCMFVNVPKCRNGIPTHRLVQMDGLYSRILDASQRFTQNEMRMGGDDAYFVANRDKDAPPRHAGAAATFDNLTG